jgi:hypothetical protein
MANRQTAGYGFRSAGTLGNTPAVQGLSKYFIDAAVNVDLFYGQAVQVTAGYIVTAEDATTAESVGVLYGIFYEDASTLKPTFNNHYNGAITPATAKDGGDIVAFVNDYPWQVYHVATDAAVAANIPAAHAKYLDTFSGSANTGGSTTNGMSSNTLDIAEAHATNNTWRLLRGVEDPENGDLTAAFCNVEVVQNLNQFIDSSGS